MTTDHDGLGHMLSRWLEVVLAYCALAIVTIVIYQIVARGMSISIRWTEELARLICIWAVFLALPVLMRRCGLIRIEYFFDRIPIRFRLWVLRAEYGSTAALMIFLAALTINQMVESWDQTSAGLVWSMGYFTMPIALGALIGLYFQFESRQRLLTLHDGHGIESTARDLP